MLVGVESAPRAAAGQVNAWPAADLQRRIIRALEFAAVAVADFGTTGYADPVRPALGFGSEKVTAEAAMLAYVAGSVDGPPALHDAVDTLIRQIEPLVRSPMALADMARNPDRVFRRLVPHVLLTAVGRPDEAFDDVAGKVCERVLTHAVDQPATVVAERRWITGVWGRPMPAVPEVPDGTILTHPFDLLVNSREDPYGLTHLLFYVTDFGRIADIAAQRPHREILDDVEGLLLRYLEQGDYDLVGELLMAWPQLHRSWSPAAAFAFRVLAHVEDEVGLLPCGNVDPQRLAGLHGAERTRYARAASYHTALVMGFLCSVALRADAAPPVAIVAPHSRDEAWGVFRDMLDGHPGDFLPVFDSCPVPEKRALAPALLDLVLHQALRRGDYAGLRCALAAARRFGLQPDPMQRAVGDLLEALESAAAVGASRR